MIACYVFIHDITYSNFMLYENKITLKMVIYFYKLQ